MNMPRTPTTNADEASGVPSASTAPAAATSAAPITAPAVPSAVTPPLVPGDTILRETMLRGGVLLQPPVDVAQVSAAAAARLAVTIHSAAEGTRAPAAAAPPLASTCHASRVFPFASSAELRSGAIREMRLDPTKNVPRASIPGMPVPYRIAVPTSAAATVPDPERERVHHPARAMTREMGRAAERGK